MRHIKTSLPFWLLMGASACNTDFRTKVSALSSEKGGQETDGGEGPGPTQDKRPTLYVENASELPGCDNATDKVLAYIEGENTFRYCNGIAWITVDLKGEKGDPGQPGANGASGANLVFGVLPYYGSSASVTLMSRLTIAFSVTIDPSTLDANSISLTKTSDNSSVPYESTYSSVLNELVITPLAWLDYDTEYKLSVSSAVKSMFGEATQPVSHVFKSDTKTAQVVAFQNATCLILLNGNVRCFGNNDSSKLGTEASGSYFTRPEHTVLGAGKTAKKFALGLYHACAILNDDSLKCWGSNAYGQLGTGNNVNQTLPKQVNLGGKTVKDLALGALHTCIILSDDTLQCFGYGSSGALGLGDNTHRNSPQTVNLGADTPKAIAARNTSTCVILNTDALKCWGSNGAGELGIGNTTSTNAPSIGVNFGARTVKSLAMGDSSACAILDDLSLWCWGGNTSGQLGIGNTNNQSTPQNVNLGMNTAKAVAMGNLHSCAILDDNSLKCWGSNSQGQLGNGTSSFVAQTTPIAVNLGANTARDVSLGGFYSCVVLDDYSVNCFGLNDNGQLGTGDTTNRLSPTFAY